MSKEIIRPDQFCKAKPVEDDESLQLNEDQLQAIADLYQEASNLHKQGKLLVGKVISSGSDGVHVNIQYKSDGFIPKYEFLDYELKEMVPGHEIEVILDELEDADGNVVLSYKKAKILKTWDKIMQLYEEDKPVEGVVTHKVKGGLSVDIGTPAFLPGSQIDLQKVTDFDQYVGLNVTASIIKINKRRGNVIISRRKFLNEQRDDARKQIMESIKSDAVIQGQVKNITNYGAFIDIGGVDGLLHITDISWGRIAHPSEVMQIGDDITVKVLSFDKDHEKISLGMKQLTPNPWENLPEAIDVGSKINGRVSSITDYGLFLEIEKGVEGLVHISEISWVDKIADLNQRFKVGDDVEALVISLDKQNKRMSLSIKRLDKNPWESIGGKLTVDQKIKGTVSNITNFGIFVQLEPGIDGLVHISDISWTEHIEHPSHHYNKGQEVEAIVLAVDQDNKKISLGIKQLQQNPWESIEDEYPVGKIVDGVVSKITNFGVFIKLPTGIEGLAKLADQDKVSALKIGEERQFRVIRVSGEDRKLGLSPDLDGPIKQEQKDDRPPRRSQKQTPKYEPYSQEDAYVAPKGKAKSQLQLELEKHAARKQKHDGGSKSKNDRGDE